jgi:probable phosphoglycerate mutase
MPESPQLPEVWLARHGETEWTKSHQHTGRADIPLTEKGERNAVALGERLRGTTFGKVYFSPLQRARRTAELAGFQALGELDPDLMEWDYGQYDGLRTDEIRRVRPEWSLFRDGCPGGESVAEVGARADRIIARLRPRGGRILLFGHSHFFRVLAVRWLDLPPSAGSLFFLGTASLSILGYEHSPSEPSMRLWNDDRHVKS